MKHLKHSKLIIILVLVTIIVNPSCFSQEISKSYNDLLLEAVKKSNTHAGYSITGPRADGTGYSPFPYVEKLCSKEAVPFLLDIIKNGHNWSKEDVIGGPVNQQLVSHIARCYAVLCLASIKAPQAYPLLTDQLQNGKYLNAPNIDEGTKRKYDIKQYAAVGLGILGDSNAVDLLISALDNPNQPGRGEIMYALAEIKDMRAIEPILNAAEKFKVSGFVLDACMSIMTKTAFPDYPELGTFKSNDEKYRKSWEHWFKVAKTSTQQHFTELYNNYSEMKRLRPNEKDAINYNRNKIAKPGIAALPLIIQKIEKGETDLIPLVSELSDNKIKSDATQKVVLDWWKANKNKYTIFDYSDSQANKD